jgi:hypothetical protein
LNANADVSVSAGVAVEVLCAGACSVWTTAGSVSLSEPLRAPVTATTVTPMSRTPSTARRNGREIAIGRGIGSGSGGV